VAADRVADQLQSGAAQYTLANLRFGLKTERWQAAAYINNIADKNAELALDYERGRSARVGYLTNQPRTIGVYGSYIF